MSAPPIYKNDIGELKELQEYAKRQFKIIYGKLYDEYTKMLMLPSNSLPAINTSAKKSSKKQTYKQKYKFNGQQYLGHRKIVKAVFDEYFKDYPSVDYQTLKHDFNMKTKFNNKKIIRIKSSLTQDELQKRVLANSERTLSCGTTIMISSQWSENDMPEFIKLANSLGYKIDLI